MMFPSISKNREGYDAAMWIHMLIDFTLYIKYLICKKKK